MAGNCQLTGKGTEFGFSKETSTNDLGLLGQALLCNCFNTGASNYPSESGRTAGINEHSYHPRV